MKYFSVVLKISFSVFFLVFLLHFVPRTFAASPNYQWTKTNSGGTSCCGWGYAIATDSAGFVYVGGEYSGTTDFVAGGDTASRTSSGGNDAYLSKYDSTGSRIWTVTFGGTGEDTVNTVAVDSEGNVYAAGYFENTVDFGSGGDSASRVSNGMYDAFITKYQSDGTRVWTKTFGSTGDEKINGITTSDSFVYITGGFNGTVNFGAGGDTASRTSNGFNDIFLSKYLSDGTRVWTKNYGGTDDDLGNAVHVDSSGTLYTGGHFKNTVDFGSGNDTASRTSAGGMDVYLSAYQSDGTRVWTKTFGGTSDDMLNTIVTDSYNNVYAAGNYSLTVNFGAGGDTASRTASNNYDIFISKYQTDGTRVWTKTVGGIDLDTADSITIDENNVLYVAGTFGDSVDFDPSSSTDTHAAGGASSLSLYIMSLFSSGAYRWTRTTDGATWSEGRGVAVYGSNIYVTGDVYGTVDFDPQGSHDSISGDADYGNMTLTKFSFTPAVYTSGMNASLVLGQTDFTSSTANQGGAASAVTLKKPKGVTIIGSKLIVADSLNNRVLIWNTLPTSDDTAADVVIGQADMTGTTANRGGSVAANTLNQPYGVASDGIRLLISDTNNDRVLIYNTVPTQNGASADLVIGQTDLTGTGYGTSQTKLTLPQGIHVDASSGKLIVTDYGNNRVLIYNHIPTSNGAAADVVVGQADFTTDTSGNTSSKFFLPYDAQIVDNKLLVADTSNLRVQIFDPVPTSNGASASIAIGQNDVNSDADTGPTATSSDQPNAIYSDGNQLFIGDWDSRILIYNSVPSANATAADNVLGQSVFTSQTANAGGIGAGTLNGNTLGIVHSANYLFVSDTENNRILRYTTDAGHIVSETPSGVSMKLTSIPTTSVDSTSLSGEQSVQLSSGGIPISDVVVDFSSDRDWSDVTAAVDTSANKSVIAISGTNTGVTGTHTLYIPKGSYSTVRICRNASSLTDVTNNCTGGVDFTGPFPQTQVVGVDTVTVSIVTINSTDYYAASGLTGSGGIAYQPGSSSNSSTSGASTSSFSSPNPPGCSQMSPVQIPDVYQIRTTRKTAKIIFSPVINNTSEYVVAYGYSQGDLRFGLTVAQGYIYGSQVVDISNLAKNTTYYVQVRAGNGCASGGWSAPMKFTTNTKTYHKYISTKK